MAQKTKKLTVPCNICGYCIGEDTPIYIPSINGEKCCGYCQKMRDYVTNEDGCTLGKVVGVFTVEEITEERYLS